MIASLEELKYEGSYPTAETIQKMYDQLDLQRAAQAYLDFMPAVSMQALLDAHPRDYWSARPGAWSYT
ncbi:MAG: hypothetical protein MUO26_08195 [Methanotrichaceae archaeon]|nr:hypothetical protein [Methanotrichaceae archaeon]